MEPNLYNKEVFVRIDTKVIISTIKTVEMIMMSFLFIIY
jgi:hypothetical protein